LAIPKPVQFDVEQTAQKLKPLSRAGGAKGPAFRDKMDKSVH